MGGMVTPPPPQPPDPPENFSINVRGVANEYRRAKKSPTKLPKFVLLAATIIWPLAAFGWGQVRYVAEMSTAKHVSSDEYLVRWGSETRLQSGQIVRLRASSARWLGMTHVSIAYAVVAIGCLAWWFYAKD
jgi:hypothetical protein